MGRFSTETKKQITLQSDHASVVKALTDARNWITFGFMCDDGHVWEHRVTLTSPPRMVGQQHCEFSESHDVGLYQKWTVTTDFVLESLQVSGSDSTMVFKSVCDTTYNNRGHEEILYTFTTKATSADMTQVNMTMQTDGNNPFCCCSCMYLNMQNQRYARCADAIMRSVKTSVYKTQEPEQQVMGVPVQAVGEAAPLLG